MNNSTSAGLVAKKNYNSLRSKIYWGTRTVFISLLTLVFIGLLVWDVMAVVDNAFNIMHLNPNSITGLIALESLCLFCCCIALAYLIAEYKYNKFMTIITDISNGSSTLRAGKISVPPGLLSLGDMIDLGPLGIMEKFSGRQTKVSLVELALRVLKDKPFNPDADAAAKQAHDEILVGHISNLLTAPQSGNLPQSLPLDLVLGSPPKLFSQITVSGIDLTMDNYFSKSSLEYCLQDRFLAQVELVVRNGWYAKVDYVLASRDNKNSILQQYIDKKLNNNEPMPGYTYWWNELKYNYSNETVIDSSRVELDVLQKLAKVAAGKRVSYETPEKGNGIGDVDGRKCILSMLLSKIKQKTEAAAAEEKSEASPYIKFCAELLHIALDKGSITDFKVVLDLVRGEKGLGDYIAAKKIDEVRIRDFPVETFA